MKKTLLVLYRTMKWFFIVLLVYLSSLFFREQRLPGETVESAVAAFLPSNVVVHVGWASFGFSDGIRVNDLKVYDSKSVDLCEPVCSFERASLGFVTRKVEIEGLQYKRLPESYYREGNEEKNEKLKFEFPDLGVFELVLVRPDILSVRPERVTADISLSPDRFSAKHIQLKWPGNDAAMRLSGFCTVDLTAQEVVGEVSGCARQSNIRPLIETLDIPVALPYIDAFTGVRGPVPAKCGWRVNLVNNDFDLDLDLKPLLGKYNGVPMQRADGKIHLHVFTRGKSLNYRHEIGPVIALSQGGKPLEGTVKVTGIDGYNTVDVEAESAMPIAQLLRIGGFLGDYVDESCIGESRCALRFEFPRSMTNNYEVLNGSGRVKVKEGQLLRMHGFAGLLELLADKVPTVSWFTDSTQASCDYRIKNGVLSTENLYIEGSVFSIKMYGDFDTVRDSLDFTVRVQFTKKDSLVGKILHPITWPFTKLLLEFKLTGSSENPQWRYISVVDRVVEAVK